MVCGPGRTRTCNPRLPRGERETVAAERGASGGRGVQKDPPKRMATVPEDGDPNRKRKHHEWSGRPRQPTPLAGTQKVCRRRAVEGMEAL